MLKISFLFPIFAIAFLSLVIMALAVFYKVKTSKWPYLKKDSLLTEAERKFYLVLLETIGNDYLIFSKVRMADLLYLPKMNNSQYYHYQNKIQSKHVDFLICDKENIKPLLVVELDDSSHLKIDRILRDELVNEIFKNAKLPIFHVRASANYEKESLLSQIKSNLSATFD
ncbi:MAG TPA: DUF2726 domain-containing protein [Candidatus Moranbacteria bacterium]|nr:DUF2726 domain-containing protein [Candidatus Moranbacteria bacterium]HRY28283.1 DUF2726 domain-containing protein [Candidatus Moranbacteria bacterium]